MSTYSYIAAALQNSLTILDVTNPLLPTFKGNIMGAGSPNYLGMIFDVAKVGNYAYCSCTGSTYGGDACLTIIDVTNPAVPVFVSTLPVGTGTWGRFVFISGNTAYVTDEQAGGLYIIDISNPAAPSITGSILYAALGLSATANLGRPYKVGNYCYIASYDSGHLTDDDNALLVVDISNPAAPTLHGSIRGVANHLKGAWAFPSGNYAYFAALYDASGGALTILDISNPAAPAFVSWIGGIGAPNYLRSCVIIWKEGNYCYCGTGEGFTIIDVSNPNVPAFVSNLPGGFGVGISVQKLDNYCYIGDPTNNRVAVVDVSNVAVPAIVGSISGADAPNYLNYPVLAALQGSWQPGPGPSPYSSPPCIIDFKGLLDCIGWKWRAGGI